MDLRRLVPLFSMDFGRFWEFHAFLYHYIDVDVDLHADVDLDLYQEQVNRQADGNILQKCYRIIKTKKIRKHIPVLAILEGSQSGTSPCPLPVWPCPLGALE